MKNKSLTDVVLQIVEKVRRRGDRALFDFEKKFNGISINKK
ncbi:MAG: histidinol dehydrogenase, partial [Elusimicrobia bacterium]|nr:histidinol dehydrogenase [Elusimicrobiota bacterium]